MGDSTLSPLRRSAQAISGIFRRCQVTTVDEQDRHMEPGDTLWLVYLISIVMPVALIAKWWTTRCQQINADFAGSSLATQLCEDLGDPPIRIRHATLKVVNKTSGPLRLQQASLKGWVFQGVIEEMLLEDLSSPFTRTFPSETSIGSGDAIHANVLIRVTWVHRIFIRRSRVRMKVVAIDAWRIRRTINLRSNLVNWREEPQKRSIRQGRQPTAHFDFNTHASLVFPNHPEINNARGATHHNIGNLRQALVAPEEAQVAYTFGRKITWPEIGFVSDPGRYQTKFGWLNITTDDLAIWHSYPNAAFTLVKTIASIDQKVAGPATGEEYRLGIFDVGIAPPHAEDDT
jgi:hypothetical protein